MDQLSETLSGLVVVGGFVLIVYFVARFTFLTKRMLAEKGVLDKNGSRVTKLDIAYVTIGLGVGLLLSALISSFDLEEDTTDLLAWGVILISGAAGLIFAAKRKG